MNKGGREGEKDQGRKRYGGWGQKKPTSAQWAHDVDREDGREKV